MKTECECAAFVASKDTSMPLSQMDFNKGDKVFNRKVNHTSRSMRYNRTQSILNSNSLKSTTFSNKDTLSDAKIENSGFTSCNPPYPKIQNGIVLHRNHSMNASNKDSNKSDVNTFDTQSRLGFEDTSPDKLRSKSTHFEKVSKNSNSTLSPNYTKQESAGNFNMLTNKDLHGYLRIRGIIKDPTNSMYKTNESQNTIASAAVKNFSVMKSRTASSRKFTFVQELNQGNNLCTSRNAVGIKSNTQNNLNGEAGDTMLSQCCADDALTPFEKLDDLKNFEKKKALVEIFYITNNINNASWQEQLMWLCMLRKVLKFHPETIFTETEDRYESSKLSSNLLRPLFSSIAKLVNNTRISVRKAAIISITELLKIGKKKLLCFLDEILEKCLKKASQINDCLCQLMEDTLLQISIHLNSEKLLQLLISKYSLSRRQEYHSIILRCIAICIDQLGQDEEKIKNPLAIAKFLLMTSCEANINVRTFSEAAMVLLILYYGEAILSLQNKYNIAMIYSVVCKITEEKVIAVLQWREKPCSLSYSSQELLKQFNFTPSSLVLPSIFPDLKLSDIRFKQCTDTICAA